MVFIVVVVVGDGMGPGTEGRDMVDVPSLPIVLRDGDLGSDPRLLASS